ncbi:MAG: hypothetical protein QGD92_10150, partial [Gammaproteobacteria bacterium]|nr:hypothetical protein [Gammaproteobacteria bacterium]
MPDVFLQLPVEDRKAIFTKASQQLGRNVNVLEKDVWVCWVLDKLFTHPDVRRMSFNPHSENLGGLPLSWIVY